MGTLYVDWVDSSLPTYPKPFRSKQDYESAKRALPSWVWETPKKLYNQWQLKKEFGNEK